MKVLDSRNDDVFDTTGQAAAVISIILKKYFPEGHEVSFNPLDAYFLETYDALNCYFDEETGLVSLKVERVTDDDDYIPRSKRS